LRKKKKSYARNKGVGASSKESLFGKEGRIIGRKELGEKILIQKNRRIVKEGPELLHRFEGESSLERSGSVERKGHRKSDSLWGFDDATEDN